MDNIEVFETGDPHTNRQAQKKLDEASHEVTSWIRNMCHGGSEG